MAQALEQVQSLKYVYKSQPTKFTTPFAVVLADDPYITMGERFGTYRVNVQVELVAKLSASRTVIIDSLDEVIADVLDTVGSELALGVMESPNVVEIDGSNYLSIIFKTSKIYERTP